jgi:thymidylate synthase
MAPNRHQTLAGAYRQAVGDVLERGRPTASVTDPLSVGSAFGEAERPTREIIGYGFEVVDPHMCVIRSKARDPKLDFCFAMWLWTLAGSDDARWISHYNARGATFSDDGVRLNGAFGHRLRSASPLDQLHAVIAQLRTDPTSRRAVAHIASPVDALGASRDRPCAIALQYFIREGRLEAVTYMRSQSAAMVLPYDAFVFMATQYWLAAVLGIEAGAYHHITGSFHVYEEELELAKRVLAAPVEARAILSFDDPERDLADAIAWEAALRDAVASGDLDLIRQDAEQWLAPSTFAEQLRAALVAHAMQHLGVPRLAAQLFEAAATDRGGATQSLH